MTDIKDKNGVTLNRGHEVSFPERTVCGHKVSRAVVMEIYRKHLVHDTRKHETRWTDDAVDLGVNEQVKTPAGSLTVEIVTADTLIRQFEVAAAECEVKAV